MMRFVISVLVMAVTFVAAGAAGAVSFIVTDIGNSAGSIASPLGVGDVVTVGITVDASDLSTEETTGFSVSLGLDGLGQNGLITNVTGTQVSDAFQFPFVAAPGLPPTLLNGIGLLSPLLPNNNQDPDNVRVGVWGSPTVLSPNGSPIADFQWGVEQVATVSFEIAALPVGGNGEFNIAGLFAGGDGFDAGGTTLTNADIDSFGLTVFTQVIPIPEPGTALLMGLGLVGLAGAGRRKA